MQRIDGEESNRSNNSSRNHGCSWSHLRYYKTQYLHSSAYNLMLSNCLKMW